MTTVWNVRCKDCGKAVPYSDAARASALDRGQSPPERCSEHRAKHRRETSRLGAAYFDLEPGRAVPTTGLKAGRFGRIQHPERPHTSRTTDPKPVGEDEFGIKDDDVRKLLEKLKKHQVAIVQAGTGSGKSTFLPWRLLVPPKPFVRDHMTRHGQIVVTQPRIDASTGIPEYVASRLHGSAAGPGLDIGYRNSKATDKTDAANKLVYLTDGTLVNMIRRGEMYKVSTVVIDEAHERSLNIDLILALLRREMRSLPHLRLLIVSATLDESTFTDFFAPDYNVAFCEMPSKTIHPVYERWRTEEPIPLAAWSRRMPEETAARAVEVLRWMALGERPADVPDSVPAYNGDILCFLPGKRPISTAIEAMRRLLENDEQMAALLPQIELLPLHSELPSQERRRPLDPKTRHRAVQWRVIVSTNLAETSLTIDGIRHVVDSGLNNLTSWDPATASAEMRPAPHSRAGLLQRRGRAGRTAPGVWHCLFTKEQFDQLVYATEPEISRSPLTAVVLNAASAGVSDPQSLSWLPPGPSSAELIRARADLLALGAITDAGDPTAFGREINSSRGEFADSTILINADAAGCAVEAATALALKSQKLRGRSLLRWSTGWPAAAKVHVDDVHSVLLEDCTDDVEVVCRVVSYWESQPPAQQREWCQRHYVDHDFLSALISERATMLAGLQSKTKTEEVRSVDQALLPRLRAVIAWSSPNAVYATERADDGRLILVPVATPRSDADLIAAMHDGARAVVDPRSRAHRQAPPCLVMLDRSRGTRWTSPLAEPETVQQGSICAAVDLSVLKSTGTLLGVLLDVPCAERRPGPVYLPGDRFSAWAHGGALRLLDVLPPLPDPTVELGFGDVLEDGVRNDDGDDILRDEITDEPEDYVGAFAEEPVYQPQDSGEVPDCAAWPPEVELIDHEGADGLLGIRVIGVRNGVLLVVPDRFKTDFDDLEAAHPIGSDFVVTLEEVRTFPRDGRPLLLVRDRQTRQRLVLDGGQLGTGLRYAQTRQLQPGAELQLTAEGYDHDRLTAHLGQTAATIGALTSLSMLASRPRGAVVITANLVDADEGKLWVQIVADELSRLGTDTPPLVLSVESGRLPPMHATLTVGGCVRARIYWGRRTTAWADVRDLDVDWRRLPDGPWEIQGDHFVITAPPTVADWRRFVEFCRQLADETTAAKLRTSVARNVLRILIPFVEVIDHVAIQLMREEGRVDAVITASDERGVTVRLPSGGTQRLRADELAWNGSRPDYRAGAPVKAFVTLADPASGDVRVELRDPAKNPLLLVREGQLATGVVTGATRDERKFRVELSGVASATAFLRNRDAPNVEVGDTVQVRITAVRLETSQLDVSCWLFDQTIALPQQMEALWFNEGRLDRWPLTRLLPDDVQLDIRNGDQPCVRVYARHINAGARGRDSVGRVLAGKIRTVAVPDLSVLTNDDYALLRRFAPHAALATRRAQIDDRPVSVVVVAASTDNAIEGVVTELRAAYPQRWVSEPFRRTSVAWQAAKDALKLSGVRAWASTERFEALSGPPYWRLVLSGEATAVTNAYGLMSTYLSIPGGTWREDERIRIL